MVFRRMSHDSILAQNTCQQILVGPKQGEGEHFLDRFATSSYCISVLMLEIAEGTLDKVDYIRASLCSFLHNKQWLAQILILAWGPVSSSVMREVCCCCEDVAAGQLMMQDRGEQKEGSQVSNSQILALNDENGLHIFHLSTCRWDTSLRWT